MSFSLPHTAVFCICHNELHLASICRFIISAWQFGPLCFLSFVLSSFPLLIFNLPSFKVHLHCIHRVRLLISETERSRFSGHAHVCTIVSIWGPKNHLNMAAWLAKRNLPKEGANYHVHCHCNCLGAFWFAFSVFQCPTTIACVWLIGGAFYTAKLANHYRRMVGTTLDAENLCF